ncbi:Metabotropic glutamate receptor 3 [Desmophyllum pertusum]|uniref:Metabotropic glutamate receptor 3 n=1 Tax=Desmophyllum pertusum TaxID=174260 RepID=A0A9W9ZB11_9CNID|nr:Metabotropic glutamate receptor 3 [Desmophyllum pertusum]
MATRRKLIIFITEFLKHPNVRGVILFCTDTDARRLLKGAQRKKAVGRFIWVASDYWGTRTKPIEGLEKYAEGAITVSLTEANFSEFKAYFTSLKPENRSR